MDNIILIDWFAVTFRGGEGHSDWTVSEIIDFLQFKKQIDFQELPGRYRYRNRLSFGNIHIYYNSMKPESDFPMLELTGQGCREFETFSELGLDKLIEICSAKPQLFHVVRMDIAYDDHTGVFDIKKIAADMYARNYVSSSSRGILTCSIKQNTDGFSCFFGSKSSDIYLRIYDKAFERGFHGRHWIRCELVLKQDNAVKFLNDSQPLGVKYRGVIYNYLRFVTPSKTDTNKRRWKMRKYWADFLDNAERISLFTKKEIDYNVSRLSKYVFGQAGNSIDTYIKCMGLNNFLEQLLQRDSKLSAKQKYLIEQCKFKVANNEEVSEKVINEFSLNYDNMNNSQENEKPDCSRLFDENGEYLPKINGI